MASSSFGSVKSNATLAALLTLALCTSLKAQSAGPNVSFDPSDSHTNTTGGAGDFATSDFWDGTTDAPLVSGTNIPGTFVPGDGAIFNGPASTVTVSSAVNPDYLEVGVTSGTETFGTALGGESTINLPVGWNPSAGPNFTNPINIDAGSENVVFNSNVNLGIINHFYGGATLGSSTTGNIAFNGGIAFTNNATDGDNIGQPGIVLQNAVGGTFTINSAVTYTETAGSSPLTNSDNVPYVLLNTAGSTLTLTSNATFSDVTARVYAGTVLDQGATYTTPHGTNYLINVGGTGQYLTDTAGMTVTPNIVFANGGGTIGGALAAETTFSSIESVAYNGTVIKLTSAAGGRVNFTGDVHSGQGNGIVKIGAGTINLDDTGPRGEDQTGSWEVQNGTMLLNGTVSAGSAISGSGVTIDNVATGALVANVQTYATLGGIGSTNLLVTAAGANSSISPGDPKTASGIGTLTLAGGLAASSGATFNFDLNGAKANGFDTVAFSGSNLTLGGTVTFNFTNLGGTLDSGPYNLLTGFSPLVTGGSHDTAAFILNGPAGYVATLDPSDFLAGATNVAVDFTPATVPEPSTWAMLIGGAAVLGLLNRRRLAARI